MLLIEALSALSLLTRCPVGRFLRFDAEPDFARSTWAFPLVGLAIGALAGLLYWLASRLGAPPLLAAVWSVAAAALMTGALHEDGLADVADGFGGGATRERKLEIMRDSRIGAFGALALILSSLVRVGALAALADPARVTMALILSGMLGRAGIIVILLLLKPARRDGLAASITNLPRVRAGAGLIFATFASFVALPVLPAAVTVGAALLVCLAVAALASAHIGGHTGDVLGAAEIVVECVVLTVIASAFS